MSDESNLTYCYYHPTIETSLRCNNCDRYICPKDAVLIDTGYRCKECVKKQQKIFDTSEWYDYLVISLVTGFLSFLGSILIAILPGWFGALAIIISPAVGGGIAEISRRSVGGRRSARLFQLATIAAFVGSLPLLLINLITFNLWEIIWLGVYAFSVTSALAYRLRGIRL
jgi:hypothetical protein